MHTNARDWNLHVNNSNTLWKLSLQTGISIFKWACYFKLTNTRQPTYVTALSPSLQAIKLTITQEFDVLTRLIYIIIVMTHNIKLTLRVLVPQRFVTPSQTLIPALSETCAVFCTHICAAVPPQVPVLCSYWTMALSLKQRANGNETRM